MTGNSTTTAPAAGPVRGRGILAVGAVWGSGVLAAAVLGAVAPISGILQDELGLSLVQTGWTTSIVTCVAAALGLPAGVLIRHVGFRTALLAGLLILGVAGMCAAFAGGFGALLVSRLVAGAGYLLVFVAGPVALMRITEGTARGAALALWGTCVPIGLGASAALGGAITVTWGWRAWLALLAVTPLLLLVGVLRNLRSTTTIKDEGHRTAVKLRRRPVLLATAFAGIAAIGVAVTTLLPRYLTEQHGLSVVDAGFVTAVLSFSNVLGSVAAALLLRRSRAPQRALWWIVVVPVVVTVTFASFTPTTVAIGAGLVVLVSNGFLVSLMFALVPYTVDDGDDTDLANGVLAQLGSLGTLLAPPLFSAAVTRFDWGSTGVLSAVLAALAVVSSMFCFRRQRSEG